MKNVMLIISMLLLCIGVGAQTAKNVGKAGGCCEDCEGRGATGGAY